MAEQREDDVATRVDVVHRDEQLPEPRLSKIVREELDIPTGEIVRVRRSYRRRSANQIPQFGASAVEELRRAQW